MSELEDLYQDMVIVHNSRPRNFRKLDVANRSAEGYNPLCGDRVSLYLNVEDGVIADIGFIGSGCAISKASSSLMTEIVKGKNEEEVDQIFNAFHHMITREPGTHFDPEPLGDLEILSGISKFPVRVKCATISWHTLYAALKGTKETVTNEQP